LLACPHHHSSSSIFNSDKEHDVMQSPKHAARDSKLNDFIFSGYPHKPLASKLEPYSLVSHHMPTTPGAYSSIPAMQEHCHCPVFAA
jgi:hypothetical protein